MKNTRFLVFLSVLFLSLSVLLACFPTPYGDENESNTLQENEGTTEGDIITESDPTSDTEGDTLEQAPSDTESNSESDTESNSESEPESDLEESSDGDEIVCPLEPVEINERYFIFRVWNFEILTLDKFKAIVDEVVKDGFNAVKIHIPWHHVETVSGVYDYSAFDPLVNYAVNEKGLKVAISVDLTRLSGDKVLSDSDMMYDADGNICIGGSAPGNRMEISFNSENAVDKAVAFYSDITAHYDSLFGDDILFYLPAFSQYAETEYFPAGEYDYSDNAKKAFRDFLKVKYPTVSDLNRAIGANFSSFDEIDPPSMDSVDNFGILWYNFRHESLKGVIDRLASAQDASAPDTKLALQFGSVWCGISYKRGTLGFVDLCENVDVLWVDDGPLTNHSFSMDYIRSALPSHIELAQEIDGPYHSTATPELYRDQGLICFERGATYVSIANWFINADYERYRSSWQDIASTWLCDDPPEMIQPSKDSPVINVSLYKLLTSYNMDMIMARYDHLSGDGEFVYFNIVDDLTDLVPTDYREVYSYPTDFSNTQGGHCWYYKSYLDGTFTDMTYEGVSSRWKGESTYTLVTNGYLHPDKHDSALVFKAPSNGRLNIDLSCFLPSAQSDGIILYVLKNGRKIPIGDGKYGQIALSPLDILEDTLQIEVSAGDEIAFVVNKSDSITSDSTKLLVRIEYD